MKKTLLSLACGTLLISPVYAGPGHDHDHGAQVAGGDSASHSEERVKHCEVVEPKNWTEAIAILEEKGAAMKAAYKAQDYNTMHELSYSLEVAADYLDEESGELLEAVEKVHHSTEDGELKELQKDFPDLEKRLNDVVGK